MPKCKICGKDPDVESNKYCGECWDVVRKLDYFLSHAGAEDFIMEKIADNRIFKARIGISIEENRK